MSFSQFIKPYPDGYEDFEVGGTPVTAEILNTNYDGFLLGLNEFLPELASMVEANPSESATAGNLTKLKVGNSIYLIPSGGSGGSTVEWEQLQLTGTKIATITIDNVPVDVYAPSGGGSGDEVEWTQVLDSGTEIGTITINGTPTTVYAPTPIDVEANPSGSATAGDLTKLKVGSSIYSIPSGEGSGGGFGLVQSGHTVYTLTGQNLEVRIPITFDTPFPEVPNVVLSLSDPSRGQYYDPQTGLGAMNVTENGFDILIKSSQQAVAGDINIYWVATTKFSGNGIFHPTIYSLEEREIGVWTDGKPLYEKTIDFGALPNNTTKTVSYNISDLDYFVKIQCVAHNQNGSRNIPFVDDVYKSGDVLLDTIKSSGVIRIISHNDLSSLTGEVTLQYVKTTDTAGSGSWTPQGVPTHHYSTDEQVIGTWIDGSTLYEKTVYIASLPSTTAQTNYAHNINNIDKITNYDGIIQFNNATNITAKFDRIGTSTNVLDFGNTLAMTVTNENIAIIVGKDRSACSAYITIQYTKTS